MDRSCSPVICRHIHRIGIVSEHCQVLDDLLPYPVSCLSQLKIPAVAFVSSPWMNSDCKCQLGMAWVVIVEAHRCVQPLRRSDLVPRRVESCLWIKADRFEPFLPAFCELGRSDFGVSHTK
jgi:hypothetical protein